VKESIEVGDKEGRFKDIMPGKIISAFFVCKILNLIIETESVNDNYKKQ